MPVHARTDRERSLGRAVARSARVRRPRSGPAGGRRRPRPRSSSAGRGAGRGIRVGRRPASRLAFCSSSADLDWSANARARGSPVCASYCSTRPTVVVRSRFASHMFSRSPSHARPEPRGCAVAVAARSRSRCGRGAVAVRLRCGVGSASAARLRRGRGRVAAAVAVSASRWPRVGPAPRCTGGCGAAAAGAPSSPAPAHRRLRHWVAGLRPSGRVEPVMGVSVTSRIRLAAGESLFRR